MNNSELLDSNLDLSDFSVLDVETTGLKPGFERVIEIGSVKLRGGESIQTFHSLLNPEKAIPYMITGITGITNKDVKNAPYFFDISEKLSSFLENSVFVAHNAPFDLNFIKSEFNLTGNNSFSPVVICTVRLGNRLFPELKSKTLSSLCNHLNIRNESPHRGLGDAKATAAVFKKMLEIAKSKYGFTTVNDIVNFQYTAINSLSKSIINEKYQNAFSAVPPLPGVYYFINQKNEIIYIGKAKSLRERMRSYISMNANEKSKKIVKNAEKLAIQVTNSELTALMAEAELIKSINPIENIQLKSYGNKYFLKLNRNEAFPKFTITTKFAFDENDYFGAFHSRKDIEKLLNLIDHSFLLRECEEKEFNAGKKCYLAEIERCHVPCVEPNQTLYVSELEKIYEFLRGNNNFALTRLITRMKKYSALLKFEQAAEVKAAIDLILSQIQKSALLAEPINRANVLIEVADNALAKDYILLIEGKAYIKNYLGAPEDEFTSALNNYYENNLLVNKRLNNEDFEKLKTVLSWCSKNRTKVKTYYLADFKAKDQLLRKMAGVSSKEQRNFADFKIHSLKELIEEAGIDNRPKEEVNDK